MVCLVIYWSAIPPHVPDFSHKVDLLNKYVKVVLQPLLYTEAWSHKELQIPSIAILFWDAIHLNELGDYALYPSYGGAILFALKKLATFSEAQWQIPTCLSSHAFYFSCSCSLFAERRIFIFFYKILYLFYGPVPVPGTLACSMRRLQFGNCQTCCRSFFYCRFRLLSPIYNLSRMLLDCKPPTSLPTHYFTILSPIPPLRLNYSSSFARGLDLIEIKPFHDDH